MKVFIAGGTGFLGSALADHLRARGDEVVILSRRAGAQVVTWNPDGSIGPWAREIDGADVIVNLTGESLAGKRWTSERKRRLVDSRILPTRSLVEAIRAASRKPSVFLSASAVGFYPDSDRIVDESAAPGSTFAARLCVEWEAEARKAEALGPRVVCTRSAIVLHRDGGALAQLLRPFRAGVGGPIGSGSQWWAWIHRDDWVRMAAWAIDTPDVRGPLNVCAPEPSMNRAFARALGRVLRRPAILPMPAFALKVLFGEMAGMLLASQRAVPGRARALGFEWNYPELERALAAAVHD